MLTQSAVTTIVPVADMQRARNFYEQKLGLKSQGSMPDGGVLYSCGNGSLLELYPKPGGSKADHTLASFEVSNIESEIRSLESKGIVFEDYNRPDLTTVNHIWSKGSEKAAWFKDSEGNFLSIHQMVH